MPGSKIPSPPACQDPGLSGMPAPHILLPDDIDLEVSSLPASQSRAGLTPAAKRRMPGGEKLPRACRRQASQRLDLGQRRPRRFFRGAREAAGKKRGAGRPHNGIAGACIARDGADIGPGGKAAPSSVAWFSIPSRAATGAG